MDLVLCKNVFVCKNAFLRTFYFVKCSASHLTMSNLTNAFGAAVFFATSGRTQQKTKAVHYILLRPEGLRKMFSTAVQKEIFAKENVSTCSFLFCKAKNTKKERYKNVFWLCKNLFLHHKGANCSATRKNLDFVKM